MKLAIISLGLILISCNNSQQSFSGDQSSADVSAEEAFPEAEIVLESCTDETEGVTQATLLTEEVKNGRVNQLISYQLFVTDCDGNVKDIDGSIAFDVLANLSPFGAAIDYTVLEGESQKEIKRGKLNIARGKDLFGNTGEQYGYYTTTNLGVQTGVNSVILNLDVSGMSFTPTESEGNTLTYDIPTYLSIGDTNPIEKKVKFTTIPELR